MKRFYTEVAVGDDRSILLDGRPVKTPARQLLVLPTVAMAKAVADEWAEQGEEIDPRSMPITGFANAAIDRVAPNISDFVVPLAEYAETDLLCYRADSQPELAERQEALWDPVLAWAAQRYDVTFNIVHGLMHRPQPDVTIETLAAAVRMLDPYRIAALNPLVTISGSLVIALAVIDHAMTPSAAFDTAHLDELWQAELWGEDDFALEARAIRQRDFLAAARFIDLLD